MMSYPLPPLSPGVHVCIAPQVAARHKNQPRSKEDTVTVSVETKWNFWTSAEEEPSVHKNT